MKSNQCIPQKISKFALGIILFAAALGLSIVGLTVLPVFGFMLAIPIGFLALYFFKAHLNDQCELDLSIK